MNPFPIAAASLRRFPVLSLCTVLLVAAAVALGTAVSLLEPSLRDGATAAARKFDLLVGAPGSETQLVLSTVYLDAAPLPPLTGDAAARIAEDPGVLWASPLLLGDTYKKHPIVGVEEAFLEGAGRFERPTDAYAGALTPLESGQTFHGVHGQAALSSHDIHDTAYRVRGKLPPTGTPWDRAVLVPASSIRHAHGLEEEHAPMSALVVKPRSIADAYRLRAQLRTERSVALFPAEVLIRLYAVLGDVQSLLTGMAFLTQGAVLAGVLLAVFAGLPRRRKILAALRAMGASRLYGALALWCEVFLLLLLGGLLGLGLGYALTICGAQLFAAHTGVLPLIRPNAGTLLTFALTLGAGSLAAVFPAWSCSRTSVAAALRE